ncbi:MAG TPA: response regulator transcription factor [Candidatus Caccousia stercoris]|uniref:Stage 0 sporulation protein A homolog n=1 Tax=Candidatus Caccousia stercoris TaxID=2840723 RepID=A0A9D1FRP5_9FIRM|nr:response regulator transcription factor [Candidatus Caccousia stercoris]
MNSLLLLEDDLSLVDGLVYSLKKNDFSVEVARTVQEALALLPELDRFDLLILDVTLPDGTGFDVCEAVRRQNVSIPILFLTASDEEVNVIRGLDCGGDDYITKPFKLGELCSRIRALLRRSGLQKPSHTETLCSGPVSIDLVTSRVTLRGQPLEVTGMEYRLLCLFLKNEGITIPRSRIIDLLWDSSGNFVDDNTLSVYIRRLREKIEDDPSKPEHLLTVRGFGYQWKDGKGAVR